MSLEFLKSDTAQSTLRVCVFLITIGVMLNLLCIPPLIVYAIKSGGSLSWLPGYVAALGGLSGAGLIGKALQKRYERENDRDDWGRRDRDRDYQPEEQSYIEEIGDKGTLESLLSK